MTALQTEKNLNRNVHQAKTLPSRGHPRKIVKEFPLNYDRDFAERLLGRRSRHHPTPATSRRFAALAPELANLLTPTVIQAPLRVTPVNKTLVLESHLALTAPRLVHALSRSAKIIGFIATIGPALDRRGQELQGQGRLADTAVLDAMGSGAVEWLADHFQKRVAAEYRNQGLVAGPRFSPGYCDWPLADQQQLFPLLQGERIGIKLDPAGLMHPRKSISAIFGLFPAADAPADRELIPCRRCAKSDCIARR